MDLFVDLLKNIGHAGPRGPLHKEKLIQRPVQVRGKDGKVYTRRQWVNPEQDIPGIKHTISPQNPPEKGSKHVEHYVNNDVPHEGMTQKEAIDHHLKKMKPAEKDKLIDKFGITWEKHPTSAERNRILAIMALKSHLYSNPHLLGLGIEKLATEKKEEPGLPNDPKAYIEVMKKKLGKQGFKQFLVDFALKHDLKYKQTGHDQIDHKSRYMAVQEHFKKNPHLMTGEEQPSIGHKPDDKPEPVVTKVGENKSKLTGVSKDIDDVLKSLSEDQKWSLVHKHGIEWKHEANVSINRLRAFMALKAFLVKNPEVLGLNRPDPKDDEESKLLATKQKVGDILRPMSPKLKKQFIKQYGITWEHNDHPAIDHKNAVTALKAHVVDNPGLIGELEKALNKEQLVNTKLSVKDVSVAIKHFSGWHGKNVLKEAEGQWMWGEASLASIGVDDEDNPVLSIVNDEEGQFEEKLVPLEHVLNFLNKDEVRKDTWRKFPKRYKLEDMKLLFTHLLGIDGVKDFGVDFDGDKVIYSGSTPKFNVEGILTADNAVTLNVGFTDKTGKSIGNTRVSGADIDSFIENSKNPLHEQPLHMVNERLGNAINEGEFNQLYTPSVSKHVRTEITNILGANNKLFVTDLHDISSLTKVSSSVLKEIFTKEGVPFTDSGKLDTESDGYNRYMYTNLVESAKSKNAKDYLLDKGAGENLNPWVLIESAKKWTPEERSHARKDLIDFRLVIPSRKDHVREGLINHTHKSLEFIPFDLLSEVLCNTNLNFTGVNKGVHISSNCFSPSNDPNVLCSVNIRSHHLDHDFSNENSLELIPRHPILDYATDWSLTGCLSHEMSHAIDHLLSNKDGYLNWKPNKYIPDRYFDTPRNAYWDAVVKYSKQYPTDKPVKVQLNTPSGLYVYEYHDDNWANEYQGRFYRASDGKAKDHGVEFWATCCEHYAGALMAYKEFKRSIPEDRSSFNQWCKEHYTEAEEARNMGLTNIHSNEGSKYAHRYWHNVKYHPDMMKVVHRMFDRSDFVTGGDLSHVNQIQKDVKLRRSYNTELILYF